ncbi:hypothetical protein RLOatenuis_8780 [Rickettsiales bacterium]|nr:hypothetical protein RLOatenuis_8780 [Rickettsiales bacterium]
MTLWEILPYEEEDGKLGLKFLLYQKEDPSTLSSSYFLSPNHMSDPESLKKWLGSTYSNFMSTKNGLHPIDDWQQNFIKLIVAMHNNLPEPPRPAAFQLILRAALVLSKRHVPMQEVLPWGCEVQRKGLVANCVHGIPDHQAEDTTLKDFCKEFFKAAGQYFANPSSYKLDYFINNFSHHNKEKVYDVLKKIMKDCDENDLVVVCEKGHKPRECRPLPGYKEALRQTLVAFEEECKARQNAQPPSSRMRAATGQSLIEALKQLPRDPYDPFSNSPEKPSFPRWNP